MFNSLIIGQLRRNVRFAGISSRAEIFQAGPSTRGFFSQGSPKKENNDNAVPESKASEEPEEQTPADVKLTEVSEKLDNMENEYKSLHHKLLLKYADAENLRRDRINDVRKRDSQYIAKFGDKVSDIYESLSKICDFANKKAAAQEAEEKVRSLTEGLVMTRGLMKNILEKHNIKNKSA